MSEISKYALLGAKLSHSLSPVIHDELLKSIGIVGEYELIEVDSSQLPSILERLKNSNYKGCNITVPYKVDIMNYLDKISYEACKIGAINTVFFDETKTIGYNTDYYGFGKMLQRNNIDFQGKDIVILGTGGASKAVYQYLIDNGAGNVIFASTNIAKAREKYKGSQVLSYNELKDYKGGYLVCNCTPVGMNGHSDFSVVDESVLRKFQVAVDLIYNPMETKFLTIAKSIGLQVANGLYMLVAQAVKAQEIWQRKKIGHEVIEEIYNKLNRSDSNIILIGLPGCGKTTLGKIVAQSLNLQFVDMDGLIEKREKLSISEIFAQKGEDYFRNLESKVLEDLLNSKNKVISTGGGIVEKGINRELIKRNSLNFYIDRSVENILMDLDNNSRPLLAGNENRLFELYDKRHKLYSECSNYTVDNNGDLEFAINSICKIYLDKNEKDGEV